MFVIFINVFTRIRMVSCQGVYSIWRRSFYVKLPFFNELCLTLQTDFAARWCFWFSANDSFCRKSLHTRDIWDWSCCCSLLLFGIKITLFFFQTHTHGYIVVMATKVIYTTLRAPWQDIIRVFRCPSPTFIFSCCSCVFIMFILTAKLEYNTICIYIWRCESMSSWFNHLRHFLQYFFLYITLAEQFKILMQINAYALNKQNGLGIMISQWKH